MLLTRPYPLPSESLPSYLLRLISANHYRNPVVLLQYLGATISNNRLPAKKIWFGAFDTQAVEQCANLVPGTLNQMAAKYIGPSFISVNGKKLREHAIQFNRLKVCPICLIDNHRVDLSHSFSAKTLCPKHGVKLLTHSPLTGGALTWTTHYLFKEVKLWEQTVPATPTFDCEWRMNQAIEHALTTDICTPSRSLGELDLTTLLDLLYFFARFNARLWLTPNSKIGKIGLKHHYKDIYDALFASSVVSDKVKLLIRPIFEQYSTRIYPNPIMSNAVRLNNDVLHNSNTINAKQDWVS